MNGVVVFNIIVVLIVALIGFLALTGVGGQGVSEFGQAASVIILTTLLITSSGMGLNCELKKDKDKKNQNNVIFYGVTIACGLVLFLSTFALNREVLANTLKRQINTAKTFVGR